MTSAEQIPWYRVTAMNDHFMQLEDWCDTMEGAMHQAREWADAPELKGTVSVATMVRHEAISHLRVPGKEFRND